MITRLKRTANGYVSTIEVSFKYGRVGYNIRILVSSVKQNMLNTFVR